MENKIPLLEMKNISKTFPGVKALDNVELRAYSGEVMALMGENGAGKSTLMKVLSGVYKKDGGEIFIEGKKVEINGIKESQGLGVSIIHQELSLLQNLSIWENIFLGDESVKGVLKKLNKKEMIEKSRELLNKIGLRVDPRVTVKELTVGEMQMIEIVKATSKNARLIIMDEPTTALTDVETKKLFEVIKGLKNQGIAIIYISHRLEEIFNICDRVTVMRDGCYIGEDLVKNIDRDKLISMMVGRKLEEQYPYLKVESGKAVLEVKNICDKSRIKNASFVAKEGEILGIAGLMGSGRTELAKLIFGEYKKTSGEILLNGKSIDINSPMDAIKNGIAYLSEDRKKEGVVLNLSVGNNMTLANLKSYAGTMGKINKKLEKDDYNTYSKKLKVKTTGYHQLIKNLSGGNQQKVILAKWIMMSPKVLIVDEPTRGIDVGAKKEIYEILNQLKKDGKAIIVISSDMEEILGISDRIIVMSEGKITGEVSREEANQQVIMKYAVGIS